MSKQDFPQGDAVYIVAEAGVNHNGDVDTARKLIDVAAEAGANAVKFQLFDPEEIASHTAPLAAYQEEAGDVSHIKMLQRLALSYEDFRKLAAHAATKHIDFIITPFDAVSADFLASLHVPAIKIASGELTNLPFLCHVAQLGLPVIISTGMASIAETRDAVHVFKSAGVPVTVLHCTSAYPTPYDQVHLRAMATLGATFGVPVGLSDHTEGTAVSIAAAALGARVIEKHFTLDRMQPGPDHKASLDPVELVAMVRGIRIVEQALGVPDKQPQQAERDTAAVARRSVVAVEDLHAGMTLTLKNTAIKRPGTGIAPKERDTVLGKTVRRDIAAGMPVTYDDLA